MGIHWCLTPDDNTKDGNTNLTKVEENKDKILYDVLKKGRGNIENIKKYLPSSTNYYSEKLVEYYNNYNYEEKAIQCLSSNDIIFFDPDNGLEIPSLKNKDKYKYVSYSLLKKFWEIGKTLIIYQHGDRIKNSLDEKVEIIKMLFKNNANIATIKKNNVNYICIINGKPDSFCDRLGGFVNTDKNKGYNIKWN
ncbi:MAG: hypothetical protein Ta2B_16560 [Termitinemataceae bacterium]|nr:MAG: hypothetical protein Ta2B_16560 [Termitinemataceae bacterium]